jgi:hypothetical protein
MGQEGLPISLAILSAGVILGAMFLVAVIIAVVFFA